jgi:hypothetical protein
MRFGGKMNNGINLMFVQQLLDKFRVADISLRKGIARIVRNILEVFKAACIGQGIQIEHMNPIPCAADNG